MKALLIGSLVVIVSLIATSGCGKSSAGAGTFPLVTPPVKAAAPAGLKTRNRVLDPADIRSRFFSAGPTNIFTILTNIDTRIGEINTRTTSTTTGCTAQAPVAYTISPWGQSVTMYASCYEIIGTPTAASPGLIQWGTKDGAFYLYSAQGAARVAAIATPIAGTSHYTVKAWMGVGYTNAGTSTCTGSAWDGCSYGVLQIDANSNTNTFEMAVAGIGFGYCGAQLKSDGTNIWILGSADGVSGACQAQDNNCVLASDATTTGSCTPPLTTFSNTTAIGRAAISGTSISWAADPTNTNVTLNGSSSDALAFGPTTATTGVASF